MWDMPWTDSALFIEHRLVEEFLKRRFGNFKVKFSIPINWIEQLDLFTSFRLQEPFGLDGLGQGEYGRYYYVESLTYDFQGQKMEVVGIDLQYILRQCVILGDCDSIPRYWEDATNEQRMYGYLCACSSGDGGEFPSDGEPCKILCPCRE